MAHITGRYFGRRTFGLSGTTNTSLTSNPGLPRLASQLSHGAASRCSFLAHGHDVVRQPQ